MKFLKRAAVAAALISILYIVGLFIAPQFGLTYQLWADLTGTLVAALLLPFLLVCLAGGWLFGTVPVPRAGKVVLGLLAGMIYLVWLFVVGIFLIFTIQEERFLTSHLLVKNESEFLGPTKYGFYRPVAVFFKEPAELTDKVKAEYLEETYGRVFRVITEGENVRIVDEEYPSLDVDVYCTGMQLDDNYAEKLCGMLVEQGLEEYRIERNFYISHDYAGRDGWLYLELKDEEDIEKLAEHAVALIRYVTAYTDFFETNRGMICFYSGEGEEQITGNIPFGKLSTWDRVEEGYYQDVNLVAARIREKVEDEKEFLKRQEEYRLQTEESSQEQSGENGTETSGDGSELGQDVDENQPAISEQDSANAASDPIETAARIIYDTVLSNQGYSYEVCYNAKGNFYLNLGERPAGEPEDQSSTGTYRFTLVYDRTSKNGACELFVLYKEHMAEDENGGRMTDGTAILDMYAVETETGKVAASGKTAWSDLGKEEYRELTGE